MTPREDDRLKAGWAMLSTPLVDEFEAYDLDESVDGAPCRLAIDLGGVRHLLIPLVDPRPVVSSPSQTLSVAIRRLKFGAVHGAVLDISCADSSLAEEFDEVILSVLEEIGSADDVQKAALACVDRWRRLFRSRLIRGLTPQAQIGLFAELSVLEALLTRNNSIDITCWVGPARSAHDFELPESCIEVKGSGPSAERVVIHGIAQLEAHGGRTLRLVLLRVVYEPQGGTSLDELVESVRDTAGKTPALERLLNASGWGAGLYADRFAISEVRSVEVDAGVPSLTSRHLTAGAPDPGVGNVQYEIQLDALTPVAPVTSLGDLAMEIVG